MTWIDFWLLVIKKDCFSLCYDSQDTKQLIPFLKQMGEFVICQNA